MAQQLIVEGNDAIALAKLLEIRGLSPPVGYESRLEFQDKFIKSAGGYPNTLIALEEALDNPDLRNIGIIVDADNAGPKSRWGSLKNCIAARGHEQLVANVDIGSGGIILRKTGTFTLGVWIMPDNQSNGYLEHFLTSLIDQTDSLWHHTRNALEELEARNLQRFTATRSQKAMIHTWLAWQKEPGKPFGTAISMGYLNANAPAADNFETWFKNTFELSA